MKLLSLALMLATTASAENPQMDSNCDRDAGVFSRLADLADQPTFDFPISRSLGIDVDYQLSKPATPNDRVFSFYIAMTR